MEKDQGNPGDVRTKYSARWLFRKGTEADPGHAPVWQAWALMEKDQGNPGDVETKYSARWLFRKGTKADPSHMPTWQAWALMEKEKGKVDEAEGLLKKGLAHCPDSPELLYLEKLLKHNGATSLEKMIHRNDPQAEALLKERLFEDPKNPEVLGLYELWKNKKG
jgi:predicted Zn-dependent protease